MEKENTISLVMIAKNEEKGLERAILSCKDFVDKILISVDKNSSDKTLEIAKKYADTLIEHVWENDFSKARNNLQQYVKTKWSLMLDGHEYVKECPDLDQALKSGAEGLFVNVEMESGLSFYFPRIYKSHVKWKLPVHNYPECKTNVLYKNFIIAHDRVHFQNKEGKIERKEQRDKMNFGILKKRIKENKKDARSLFNLGQQYLSKGKFRKAIRCYKKYLKHSNDKQQKWLVRYNMGLCANYLNKPKLAIKFFKSAEKELPKRWETAKKIGATYLILHKYEKGLEYLVESFGIPNATFAFNPEQRNDAQTWYFISQGFFALKKYEAAKIAMKRSLKDQGSTHWQQLPEQQIKVAEEILGAPITRTEQKPKTIPVGTMIEVCLVVYQRTKRIPEILGQLKTQTIQNFRVNIWNNTKEDLDVSNFPADRIKVSNSLENVGSRARFYLAKKTKGNPIIFIDDDEFLYPDFIEYYYNQYLKFGSKSILGYFTRTFNLESYWKSEGAPYGQEVDYIATKAMILDREIIDKEPLLQNIPEEFAKVEDLYLCYLAREKHGMKMIKINPASHSIIDNQDQWSKIDKEKAFQELRKIGWKLLKDKNAT